MWFVIYDHLVTSTRTFWFICQFLFAEENEVYACHNEVVHLNCRSSDSVLVIYGATFATDGSVASDHCPLPSVFDDKCSDDVALVVNSKWVPFSRSLVCFLLWYVAPVRANGAAATLRNSFCWHLLFLSPSAVLPRSESVSLKFYVKTWAAPYLTESPCCKISELSAPSACW